MEELVLNLMKRGAITCLDDTYVREIAQIMVYNEVRYCIVISDKNEVTGIISARSLLKAFGENLDTLKARDILLPYTITINPHHHLREAINLMNKKHIEHLIVVSNRPGSKAIYGILSAADIVNKMAQAEGGTK